jgi:hypothetical protein
MSGTDNILRAMPPFFSISALSDYAPIETVIKGQDVGYQGKGNNN